VTDTEQPTAPEAEIVPPTPGEQRRLAHPPSDRYRAAEAKAAAAAAPRDDPAASVARGLVLALVVALLGALAIIVLGAIATVTTGLIIVAGAVGFGVGVALRFGAGGRFARGRRVAISVALTVAAIALGQVGIWQYAQAEGGVLTLVDYLAQVFGPLVVVEFVVGAVVAWLAAR
jgi:hypothetical protein